jgi:hypothetical protein
MTAIIIVSPSKGTLLNYKTEFYQKNVFTMLGQELSITTVKHLKWESKIYTKKVKKRKKRNKIFSETKRNKIFLKTKQNETKRKN